MDTVYFLGAGASAAEGLPTTTQLNYGVAQWLRDCGERGSHLRAYYKDLYGLGVNSIRAAAAQWDAFLKPGRNHTFPERSKLPDLIETLSLLDACIGEDQSLGVSSLRNGSGRADMNPGFLRRVRQQLAFALGIAVQEASFRVRARHTRLLTDSLGPEDTIISTNWDILVDRCFVSAWKKRNPGRKLAESPIHYHCVGERPVNYKGDDIGLARNPRSVLRLHGGLNWFGCACCGTVYVNLEGSYIMDENDRRPDYDDCHCGAGLLTIMVAPSYVKDYRAVSLRSVWREAQKRLEKARRWVFIGYSLPSDDFHIRAMLMRALRSQAWRGARHRAQVRVFLGAGDTASEKRYEDFFRLNPLEVRLSGFSGWAEKHARH